MLVLAGAGTGKTRVLTTRLAHILATGRARPWELLAVTFTNKAAREMRERITDIIGPAAEGLRWVGTFHSVAAQILRRHAELVGLKSSFTIIDVDDQERLIKQLLEAENIDSKRWTPAPLRRADRPLEEPRLDARPACRRPRARIFANNRGGKLYALYQDRLRVLNACDFGDLLLHNLTIFTQHPDVLADYHSRFRYILVDEYQDSNVAQYLWLRLLAQGRQNLCCVGDDDQSIYGWRGAEVDNILRFERDFPGAKVVRLERNYRSTAHILAAASGLIAANKGRLGKTLWTEAEGGQKVKVRGVWDGEAESRHDRRRDRALGQGRAPLSRMRHPGARLVPDAGVRRALRDAADPLPGDRRPALLRARRDPRRPRLSAARPVARTTTWRSSASSTCPSAASATPRVQKLLAVATGRRRLGRVAAARELVRTDELAARTRTALANFLRDLDRWRAAAAPRRIRACWRPSSRRAATPTRCGSTKARPARPGSTT